MFFPKTIALKFDLSYIIRNVQVFLFSTSMILHFCQKSKDDLLRKNPLKDEMLSIIEKDNIHPRKYGIFSTTKVKDKKFTQSNTHRENQ